MSTERDERGKDVKESGRSDSTSKASHVMREHLSMQLASNSHVSKSCSKGTPP